MQEEAGLFKQYDYSALSRMYSVGEPLNPEVYHWGKKVFGCEVYDKLVPVGNRQHHDHQQTRAGSPNPVQWASRSVTLLP